MILCDIGNSYFHFNINGKIFDEAQCSIKNQKVYFISVNAKKTKELLSKNPNSINLAKYVTFNTHYQGLGIDRIMACKTIEEGVVVDAGSAITIDIMLNSLHLGGYILPGINALNRSYKQISPILDQHFTMQVDLKILPSTTIEAISYGSIGMIVAMIEKVAKNKKIYFTGGDGMYLAKFFKNSIYIKDLVFRGMHQTIKEIKA
ncbi:MAG: type III pantothenate kinase [Epsilonproteobacteria bacterium]|jgi:type III pantothenate kinase|nr:type III pantothenate kinase [Campylobacterota bacterium]